MGKLSDKLKTPEKRAEEQRQADEAAMQQMKTELASTYKQAAQFLNGAPAEIMRSGRGGHPTISMSGNKVTLIIDPQRSVGIDLHADSKGFDVLVNGQKRDEVKIHFHLSMIVLQSASSAPIGIEDYLADLIAKVMTP